MFTKILLETLAVIFFVLAFIVGLGTMIFAIFYIFGENYWASFFSFLASVLSFTLSRFAERMVIK